MPGSRKPPNWVADRGIWEKAKKAVNPEGREAQRRYAEPYAVVAHVYRQMGGRVKRSRKR